MTPTPASGLAAPVAEALERIAPGLDQVERAMREQLSSQSEAVALVGEHVLSSGGKRIRPEIIERIQDRQGHTVYRRDQRPCDGCGGQDSPAGAPPALPDTREAVTDPATHLPKTYHVQIDQVPDAVLLRALESGVNLEGTFLAAKTATLLRAGQKNAWLEIVLEEGRNRHIRRLLEALGVNVLRLVRVAVGPLQLGALAKGEWRHLTADEVAELK